jgi:hypothetical protein
MKGFDRSARQRWWVVTLVFVGGMIALVYVVHGTLTELVPAALDVKQPVTPSAKSPPAMDLLGESPTLLFRHTILGDTYGKLAFVRLDHPEASPAVVDLRCDRVHFAAGRGVCLTARRGVFTRYEAFVFDAAFQPLHTMPLRGTPSRARVSTDGRVAALTVFVSGHSYAASGFSTHTSLVDLQTGGFIAPDLEKFTVWHNGERFEGIDFNFWGVTFSHDPHRFYATLGSAGRTYLIEGDVPTQAAWVRRSDIECPALSPDNTRIAFKKRVGGTWGPVTWRLAVLDLVTQQEWLLAETRSVDDQAEWLDDTTVLYALSDRPIRSATMHIWAVPADGGGEPRLLVAHADSAVVVRPSPSHKTWPQADLQ